MNTHEYYMEQCLALARKGAGRVSPNPMVGSLLVYKERIIGQGYHEHYGEGHAEVNCIASVKPEDLALIPLSTLYVSLEPCSHTGKTPPCTDLILTHQIKKVLVACTDISSKVNGKGIAQLKEHDVDVTEHILEKEALELNKRFFTFHTKHRPYIILKWAQSKEGFIGIQGERILLSNAITNTLVHQWRTEEDVIWVGYNTLKNDNPQLNVRLVKGKNPVRIVFDNTLNQDLSFHLFDQSRKTILFNTKENKEEHNIEWIKVNEEHFTTEILGSLYSKNYLSVLVEGGTQLLQKLIDKGLWDEARCIQTATSLTSGIKAPLLSNHEQISLIKSGDDLIRFYKNAILR